MFILGSRGTTFKENFVSAIFFLKWSPPTSELVHIKSRLLLPIVFKLCTVIDFTYERNPIDFGQNSVKCDFTDSMINTTRPAPNVSKLFPLQFSQMFYFNQY